MATFLWPRKSAAGLLPCRLALQARALTNRVIRRGYLPIPVPITPIESGNPSAVLIFALGSNWWQKSRHDMLFNFGAIVLLNGRVFCKFWLVEAKSELTEDYDEGLIAIHFPLVSTALLIKRFRPQKLESF